ncbi:hypothetical protein [Noviherbaspirillum saxi]|uniref:Uncharacterized protein n=1 Tax=Noviherbaspirillum saxi TaxID=2320863 RepID=A0A3A3FVI6_9BURK|nr:hypothetical protein [Noviherbaspirillum saxi]RJF98588.1 hypothetical protein D3871_08755 [Noviherbaspirillum saxi]
MDALERRLKTIEIGIAVVGLLGLAFGGYQTYLTYRQHAELQALRALNDAQLKICQDFVATAAHLFSVEDRKSLRAEYYKFSEIKHGQALALLDANVLDKGVAVHSKLIDALEVPDGETFRTQVRCTLGNAPFELALACRKMIGRAFQKESGAAVEPIDPTYVMNWKGTCKIERK